VLTASGGWTSNAAGATGSTPGDPSDGLFLISPGVIFTSALPRAVQRLAYTFSTQLYVNHSELDAISNRLDWTGQFLPSPTTELQLNAYVLQSQLNGFTNTDVTAAQVTRSGVLDYWGAGLTELLTVSLSQTLRITQGAGFLAYIPTTADVGATYSGNASLGLTKSWQRDSFGGHLALGYLYYGETRGPMMISPSQQQIDGSLMLEWRHDFEHFWTIHLGAGVATVFRATDGGGQIWQPIGEAGVHYVHPKIQWELLYTRGMLPNPYVQSTFVADTVSTHATVPFGEKSHLAFVGGGSYVHDQAANTINGEIGATVNLFYVDGSLNWNPREWLVVFTRYTYQNQLADASQPIASLERHLVLLGVTVTYPPQGAAVVANGPPIRVDRSDAVTIPDVHTPTR
jgi:hypothetical protein